MTNRILRYSGLGLAVLTAGAIAACGGSDEPGNPSAVAGSPSGGRPAGGSGGAPSAGAAPTTGGTAGTGVAGGATGGTSAGGGAGFACVGDTPTSALITDFSCLTPNPTPTGQQYTFVGGVLGGTFTYADNQLTLDTTGAALTVKGNIHDYDGFGIYFNTCYNAGAYTGVSFKIKGNAGATGKLNFRVQTNANSPVDASAKKGTCVPENPKNAYPDCHGAAFDIPVTATDNVVTVMFSQLTSGLPSAAVDPKDIVGLEWAFAWTPPAAGTAGTGAGGGSSAGAGGAAAGSGGASAGAGGASAGSGGAAGGGVAGGGAVVPGGYDASITIDDIMFVGGPAAGGAGGASSCGTGGTSAGGASPGGSSAGGASGSGGASAGTGGTGG